METTAKIQVLRKFYHEGKLLEIGSIITVPIIKATEYASANKAMLIPEPAKKEEPKKEEKAEPATQAATAPILKKEVGKK